MFYILITNGAPVYYQTKFECIYGIKKLIREGVDYRQIFIVKTKTLDPRFWKPKQVDISITF